MKEITLEELLEAGSHFGHQLTRQNPKARDYVYEARDGVQIIDLALTKKGLDEAAEFVLNLAKDPTASFLIVGTKKQAAPIILSEVEKAKKTLAEKNLTDGLFTVTTRWIGGTFSNIEEIKKNCKKLKDIKKLLADEFERAKYTKKELLLMQRDAAKLETYYGGILEMSNLPNAIFVVDTHMEAIAIKEAANNGVKRVGIVDTNSDPTLINYVIPANDDAVGSLKLIIGHIIEAWTEGRLKSEKSKEQSAEGEEKEESKNESSSAKATEGQVKLKEEKKEIKSKTAKKVKIEKK